MSALKDAPDAGKWEGTYADSAVAAELSGTGPRRVESYANAEMGSETDQTMTSVRIDKWLWAARFFKTRALAARACGLGRIRWNGQPAKAAREVKAGDMLGVMNDGGEFQ